MRRFAIGALVSAGILALMPGGESMALDSMPSVGQPVDIASSAYQYRADRKPEENSPESWLALMRYAGQPLNKPVDVNAPAIKQALCGLLWEEIRPLQRLELTWASRATRRPAPEEVVITTLDAQSSASSWWNNLQAAGKPVTDADLVCAVYAAMRFRS